MNSFKSFLSNNLRPGLFFSSIVLSSVMLIAAKWQWTRYHEKLELVETFKSHKTDDSIPFERFKSLILDKEKAQENLEKLSNKKISIKGEFDFKNQVLIINRRAAHGPGSWLLTPLKISETDDTILVSRGFIPYEDKDEASWKKYDIGIKTDSINTNEFFAVISKSTSKRNSFSPKATTSNPKHFLYPDLASISKSIPYKIQEGFFLHGILPAIQDGFPLTDIKIDVPPSTHFWYTLEWIGLAILTQIICFFIQLFRPHSDIIQNGQ